MTNNTDTLALAKDLIAHEGVHTYFPEVHVDCDAPHVLAEYLDAHPDAWTPAGEDSAASVAQDIAEDLEAFAVAQGYERRA